jgi:hypothetical protein
MGMLQETNVFSDTDTQTIDGLRQAIEQLAAGVSDLFELVKSTSLGDRKEIPPTVIYAKRTIRNDRLTSSGSPSPPRKASPAL